MYGLYLSCNGTAHLSKFELYTIFVPVLAPCAEEVFCSKTTIKKSRNQLPYGNSWIYLRSLELPDQKACESRDLALCALSGLEIRGYHKLDAFCWHFDVIE